MEKPIRIEFDADGDGVAEVTETEYRDLRYTYPDAGQFRATFRARDRHGRVRTYATTITVIPSLTFDAELQGRWDTLKAALRKGDVTEALDCVHSESRSKYEKGFEALFARASPANVDQVMTSITLVKNYDGSAIYEMLRTEAGRTLSYEVRFEVDADGVWRIRSF